MLPNELLAQLEALRAGRLSEKEHEKLRHALDELQNGEKEETAAFNQLWNAWDALHFEEQGAKFAEMDAGWQATDDAEIVEWYLKGELSPANQQTVETRKANDPAFAQLLDEQAQLSSGFLNLKDDDFRQQLRKWEKEAQKPTAKLHNLRSNWLRLGAIAASVLILMVAGASWFSQQNYSDEALVERFYKQPPTGNTMGAGTTEEEAYLKSFAAAHNALESKDYPQAARLFSALSTQLPPENLNTEDLKYYQDNLDWSIVLAKIGEGKPEAEINARLERIIGDEQHTYYREAVALKKDLGSFWR
jgi:hypothetical protein